MRNYKKNTLIINPVINDIVLKIIRIFEFLSPEYLNISISLFSKSLIKNNCVVIRNIKETFQILVQRI